MLVFFEGVVPSFFVPMTTKNMPKPARTIVAPEAVFHMIERKRPRTTLASPKSGARIMVCLNDLEI